MMMALGPIGYMNPSAVWGWYILVNEGLPSYLDSSTGKTLTGTWATLNRMAALVQQYGSSLVALMPWSGADQMVTLTELLEWYSSFQSDDPR